MSDQSLMFSKSIIIIPLNNAQIPTTFENAAIFPSKKDTNTLPIVQNEFF